MQIPITLLSLAENLIIGVLSGASTVALILYAISLRHGYPKEGVGHIVIQSVYTLIRLFHVFLAILVTLYIIVFGVMDGLLEAQVEYGVKAFVLVVNALIAYGMARRVLPTEYFSPVIVAGWYFIAGYHAYSLYISSMSFATPLLWYFLIVGLMHVVFIAMRHYIRPISRKDT